MVGMHLTEAKEKKRNKSFEVLLRCQERQKQNNDFFNYFFSVNGPSNGKLIRMINACGRDKRRMLERRGKKVFTFKVCWRDGSAGRGRDGMDSLKELHWTSGRKCNEFQRPSGEYQTDDLSRFTPTLSSHWQLF